MKLAPQPTSNIIISHHPSSHHGNGIVDILTMSYDLDWESSVCRLLVRMALLVFMCCDVLVDICIGVMSAGFVSLV